MLFAISGSQGSGKSTLLKALAEQQPSKYHFVDRKTSRSILDDWGVTLDQVNSVPGITIQFQEEIIRRKFQDEVEAVLSDEIVFTERTYADLFAYALVSLGKDNNYSTWLNQYYLMCMKLQQTYRRVFYLKAGHFAVEHDGVRGTNRHYSTLVDTTMLEFTNQMTSQDTLTIINTPVMQERLSIIETRATFNNADQLAQLITTMKEFYNE